MSAIDPETKTKVSVTTANATPSIGWYDQLPKSKLNPPDFVFMLVWPVLYVLMFIAMFSAPYDRLRWVVFMLQLCLNAIWPYVFFRMQRLDLALVLIVFLIALNSWITLSFIPSWSLVSCYAPYLVWLCFACYLLGIIMIQL